MRSGALGRLVWQNLRRSRRGFALSALSIALGIGSLCFFMALSTGVRQRLLRNIFPVGQLEVVPARASFSGGLAVLGIGGPKPLGEAAAVALTARPEVQAVYRRMKLAFPARAWGGAELVGKNFYAELIAEGIDPRAMAGEAMAAEFSDDLESGRPCSGDGECAGREYCPADLGRCQRPIPAVVSPFMLEVYNGAIAPSHGLPRITEFLASRLRGFIFQVELGRSFLSSASRPGRQRRVMLVGISPHASQLALTLPLSAVQKWNAEYAQPPALAGAAPGSKAEAHAEWSSLLLELRPGANVTRLTQAVRDLGYAVADSGAERAGLAVLLVTLLFALVSLAMVTLATLHIAQTFFRAVAERRHELGVLRSVGASASDVRALVLAEAAAIGVGGGLAGLVLARLAAAGVDLFSRRALPDFPFKPESFFVFDAPLLLLALLFSVLACMVGAFWPARAAARLDPAAALSAL